MAKKITKWEPEDFELEMTTHWSFPKRGDWATHDAKWRGNWSPYIPRNIILRYSKEGDLVLDQFAGGGTTLVEAKLLRRNIIGVDVNDVALNRCKEKVDFEHEGADGLAEEVTSIVRALGGGVGREDVALGNGVDDALGSLELIGIHKPSDHGTHKAAEHIGKHEGDAVAPRHQADDALGKHHGGVHAHSATKDKQADRDAKGPGGDGKHMAGALILGALEHGIAVNTHAKDDHEGRCAEFAEEFGKHKTLSFLSVINDSFKPRTSAVRQQHPGHRG